MTPGVEPGAGPPDRRLVLDPFALPAETRGRFVLLMLAVVLISTSLGVFLISGPSLRLVETMMERIAELPEVRYEPNALEDPVGVTSRQSGASRIIRSLLPRVLAITAIPLLVLLATLLLAAGHYFTHPWRLRRRHGSRPLAPGEAPALHALLQGILAKYPVHSDLTVHCKPGVFGSDGRAWGFRGREVIYLPQDPVLLGNGDRGSTASIALHELAHLVNRDTQAVERSRALRFGLLVVMVLFFLLFVRASPRDLTLEVLRWSTLIGTTWLLWIGLVRIRELYADWRVVLWGRGDDLVHRLSLDAAPGTKGPRWRRAFSRLLEQLRPHPSDAVRLATLREPARLFRVSKGLSLVTGVLLAWVAVAGGIVMVAGFFPVAIAAEYLHQGLLVLANLLPVEHKPAAYVGTALAARLLLPALLVSLLLLAVSQVVSQALGVQVQRAALEGLAGSRSEGWGYASLWRSALLLALGLELGILMIVGIPETLPGASYLLLRLAWFGIFTLLGWLWLVYNHAASRLILATRGTHERPGWSLRLLSLSASALLTVLLWPASYGRLTLSLHATAEHWQPVVSRLYEAEAWSQMPTPESFFVTIFVTLSLLLLFLAGLLFLLWGAGLLLVAFPFQRGETRCATCGEATVHRRVVGIHCRFCRNPLAPWLYATPLRSSP